MTQKYIKSAQILVEIIAKRARTKTQELYTRGTTNGIRNVLRWMKKFSFYKIYLKFNFSLIIKSKMQISFIKMLKTQVYCVIW